MSREIAMRTALGGLLALAAALGIGRFVYTPILPAMIAQLHWRAATGGLVASANYLGYLAGAIAAAHRRVAQRPRAWLIASLLLSSATTLAVAAAGPLGVTAALRFAGGVASAFVIVCASTLVLAGPSTRRAAASNVYFAGVGLGIVISTVVVETLKRLDGRRPVLWLGAGAAALACTLAAIALVPRDGPATATAASAAGTSAPQPATAPAAAASPAASRGGTLAPLATAYGLFGFGYVVTATFLVVMVRGDPALRALEPWIWALVGLAAIPSVPLWAAAAARLGTMRAFAAACLVEAAGVAASAAPHRAAAACFAAVALGGTFMGITALGLTSARERAAGGAARAFAVMTASFALGQMIGPTVAGLLADRFGSYRLPTLLAAAALAAAAALTGRARAAV